MKVYIVLIVSIVLSQQANAFGFTWDSKPSNYEECILATISSSQIGAGDVSSTVTLIRLVEKSCNALFSKDNKK